jgi:hypothetical protein
MGLQFSLGFHLGGADASLPFLQPGLQENCSQKILYAAGHVVCPCCSENEQLACYCCHHFRNPRSWSTTLAKQFRDQFWHTPLSVEEDIFWKCQFL